MTSAESSDTSATPTDSGSGGSSAAARSGGALGLIPLLVLWSMLLLKMAGLRSTRNIS
jgi:hypothetical protein